MSDSYRICFCSKAGTRACERCMNNKHKSFAISGSWKDNGLKTAELLKAIERKRGVWIKDNVVLTSMPPQYQYCCSLCGKTAFTYTNGIQYLSDYCPNCGADMRGVENEID